MAYLSMKAHKFFIFRDIIGDKKLRILDVGCGNHSPSETKSNFKNVVYHGIDIEKNPDYFESDLNAIDKFYLMDLDKLNFTDIEDNSYDIIIMNHVIEHIHHGEEVLMQLFLKLKKGGYFYIECPYEKSVNFPSVKGTLNFYDDKTHVRMYTLKDIRNCFDDSVTIVSSGRVRSIINLLLTPYKMIKSKIQRGYVRGYVYWDLFGFGNYILIKK